MKEIFRSMLLVGGTFLWCMSWSMTPVEASIVLQLSDQQMTQRAGQIVRGKVVRKYSKWLKSKRRIYTYITLAVLDRIKGSQKTTELTIRQVGGAANGIGMHVPGSAKFKLGEEVLVFLEPSRASKHSLVMGMSFGKYRVVMNPKTKVKMLERDLHGVSLAQYNAQKKLQIKHASPRMLKPKPLRDFVMKIRKYMTMKPVTPSLRKPKLQKLQPPTTPKPTLRK